MRVVIVEAEEAPRAALAAAARAAGAASVVEIDGPAAAPGPTLERGATHLVVCPAAVAPAVSAAAPWAVVLCTFRDGDDEAAVAALRGPAFDAVALPLDPAQTAAAFAAALAHARDEAAAAELEAQVRSRRADLEADEAALSAEVNSRPRVDRLRAELSAGVVGELAACMSPVGTHLERAAREVGDTPAGSAIVDSLFAAQAAVRMVSDLHDAVRSEQAPLPVAPERLATPAFLRAVLECVARVASDYEATIDTAADGAPAEFTADRLLLTRALENMLECGLRRSRKGRLRFEVTGSGPAIRFDVVDAGGAVPERLLPTLFSRVARLEGGAIQRGAALGFCRGVAQALGGLVNAQSDGPGLRLTLELPPLAA